MKELEIVKEALNKGEFYDEDSKEILHSAEDLDIVIFTFEKRVIPNRIDFRYDSKKSKFIRLNMFEDEKYYLDVYKDCYKCKTQCFSTELTTMQFLELISKTIFQRVSVRIA